jgi:sirohydrochlorin cobaltochelatase
MVRHSSLSISLRAGALLVAAAIPGYLQSQAPPAPGRVGTIIVAHGGDAEWNARVLAVAASVKTGGPVEVSFLMGPEAAKRRFQDVVAKLEGQAVSSIAVVPMLVSSHSGHYDQIRWLSGADIALDTVMQHHLHMSGIDRASTKLPIRMGKAMDDAPDIARVITDRALALTTEPSRRAVFVVGHGPNSAEDYAHWMKNLRRLADSVKTWGGFKDVRVDVVRDDAPEHVRAEAVLRVRELIAMQRELTGQQVLVVPLLVSRGSVSRDRIPNDIKGLDVVYAGEPLLPHASVSRWIESRVREIAEQQPPR